MGQIAVSSRLLDFAGRALLLGHSHTSSERQTLVSVGEFILLTGSYVVQTIVHTLLETRKRQGGWACALRYAAAT